MKLTLDWLFCMACALAVSACGPTDTLRPTGPVTPVALAGCTGRPANLDQYAMFQVAYTCAADRALAVAQGVVELNTVQSTYKTMLREGLGLVRANCSDFFRIRGNNQQFINFSHDLVAFGGTTAGAIVGLAGGGALALSIISVSGAALYGGIDIFTKDFLFGADNIEAVRALTMKTLNDNAAELLSKMEVLSDARPTSFQDVAGAIMDNQEICKPASIAAAVRIKLRSGTDGIEAAGTGGGSALSDRAVVARISELVGLPTGVLMNDGQLALVCWATTPEGSLKLTTIKPLLGDAFKNGPNTPGWPGVSSNVGYACQQQLSDVKQAVLDQKIKQFKDAGGLPGTSSQQGASAATSAPLSGSTTKPSTSTPLQAPMRVF